MAVSVTQPPVLDRELLKFERPRRVISKPLIHWNSPGQASKGGFLPHPTDSVCMALFVEAKVRSKFKLESCLNVSGASKALFNSMLSALDSGI